MKRLLALLLATLALASAPLHAATSDDACAALGEARATLLAMLELDTPRQLKTRRAQLYAASARLEGLLGQMRASDPARVSQVRPDWEAFKRTREQSILPLLNQGKRAEARALALGVQAERLARMKAALGCQ